MSAAQKELLKISQDKDAYKSMLEKLIVQSSFQLLEDKVYVICRECDKSTVEVGQKYRHTSSIVFRVS